MHGEQTDYVWGVLVIIPIADSPNIPMRCAMHSAESGSVMVIPRENKLVRLCIQLIEVNKAAQQVDRSQITPEIVLKAAQKIMSSYKLTYDYCDWWIAYRIGQRVGNRFSCDKCVFLAGDAVHTQSPKAAQGMNLDAGRMQSMLDDWLGRQWHSQALYPEDISIRAETHCSGSHRL